MASFNKINGVWVEGKEVFGDNSLDTGAVHFNCEATAIRFAVGYTMGKTTVNYNVVSGF